MDDFLKWLKSYKQRDFDSFTLSIISNIIGQYKSFKEQNPDKKIAAVEISQNNEKPFRIKIDNIENGLSIPTMFNGRIDIRFIFTNEYKLILLKSELMRLKNEYKDIPFISNEFFNNLDKQITEEYIKNTETSINNLFFQCENCFRYYRQIHSLEAITYVDDKKKKQIICRCENCENESFRLIKIDEINDDIVFEDEREV
jgi:hypothetical protein